MLVVSVDGYCGQGISGRLRVVHSEMSGHIYLWKIIYYMQFLSYDMCSSILLLNFVEKSK